MGFGGDARAPHYARLLVRRIWRPPPLLDASRLGHGAANDLEVTLQLIGRRRRLARLQGRQ
eukprot:129814-Prymnesium_polylepis.1